MPRLTIIIPSTGAPLEFEDTLASVLQHRPPACELVVALAESYDDPYELADEVRFPVYEEARSRIDLINAAIQDATSEYVHVLQCGLEVEEGWTDSAIALLDDERMAAVSPAWQHREGRRSVYDFGFLWSPAGNLRPIRRRRMLSRPRSITAPTIAASFYRRSWLLAAGGLPTCVVPELSPLSVGMRLRALGATTAMTLESRVHGECDATLFATAFARGRSIQQLRRAANVLASRTPLWPARLWSRCATMLREPSVGGKLAHGFGGLAGAMLDRGIERRWRRWREDVMASTSTLPLDGGAQNVDVSLESEADWRRAA